MPQRVKAVVGVGASAGGLEALTELVAAIPQGSGLAFVVVQHLSPDHPSIMDELLSSHTALPVRKIEHGMEVEADAVFVIPSGPALEIRSGRFHLLPRNDQKGVRTPIDVFLNSLAEDFGESACCVILSGTGTDGTMGLKAIKSAGGIAIVQEATSARFPGMPDSAAATGLVDARLNPEDIPANLVSLLSHREEIRQGGNKDEVFASIERRLDEVLDLLSKADGQDFSNYKPGILVRRIERRMMLRMQGDVGSYLGLLRQDGDERTRLLQDFLIGVTRFFRDPTAFNALAEFAIKPLLERDQDKFRIWVPGCSTGEEAYSIGILFAEAMRKADDRRELRIFGTDIDLNSLRHARAATYSDTALERMPDELIDRYFTTVQGQSKVSSRLRERIAFAPHNLLRDPPFSRIDLISCRNLLIYLNSNGQDGLVPRFHYALRRSGFLFLGPSESVEGKASYFTPVSREHRLYRRNDSVAAGFSALAGRRAPRDLMPPRHIDRADTENIVGETLARSQDYESQVDQFFLTRHSPPFLVVTPNDEVAYVSGTVGPYVRPSKGVPSARIEDMLSPEIRAVVRPLIHAVRETRASATETVPFAQDGTQALVRVVADSLPFSEGDILVVLQPVEVAEIGHLADAIPDRRSLEAVEQELSLVRRRMSTAEAGHAVAEQELRSANEELLSMNEELQSSNEELETSREELQSINEELETINSELAENNRRLNEANSDLKNVLDSTDIAKLILAPGLIVRRFTRSAKNILHIDDRDIGRRVTDLNWLVEYPELDEDALKVEETLQMVEREVRNPVSGESYEVRVRPYRSIDDKLDGCIATFINITRRKEAERKLHENREQLSSALKAGEFGVHIFYPDTGKLVWDDRMRELWNVPAHQDVDYDLFMSRLHPDDRAATQAKVDAALDPGGAGGYLAEYRVMQPDGSARWVRADGKVTFEDGKPARLVGTVKDVTDRHEAEIRMQEYAARLEMTYEVTGIGAWEWNVENDVSTWTPNLFHLLRCPRDREPSFATFASFILDEDRPRVIEEVSAALRKGEMLDTQFRILRGDGEERVLVAKGRVIYDGAGRPEAMIGINYDATEEVEKEERRQLLTNELNHRVKNSLATIQSIASHTFRQSKDMQSFRESFLGRLRAISVAHDLLVNAEKSDANVRDLVAAQVGPYTGNDDGLRVDLEGPHSVLGATVAHNLGLVLHELATNATKYGALSNERGRVEISWSRIWLDDRPGVRLVWRETGGPKVNPPSQTGFGSILIEQSLSHSVGGSTVIDYAPDGLVAVIECPTRAGSDLGES
ncbi:chemotaxis protein CheB [Tropicimonas isoalkanivorans]|uniref:histidine kinase n=1 Tax=Tropicimonas isoalkanivorans TaxID=441112 RepID=A0A1I1HQJ2_9RHOB|nr:chemotaxis protein CheB [Tropicimonas isoalkanivorans]SFC26126.1 two-component system, chemotaxis family, CheB/CheR fusion protein [Tropicimonas isoalkanivorans]